MDIQEVSSLIFCGTSLPLDTVTQPNFLHEELILLARDQVGFNNYERGLRFITEVEIFKIAILIKFS